MGKRLQIGVSDEAWQLVESLCTEANEGFDAGHITYSDMINEMILCSKPDIKLLQSKRTNIRKSLLLLSAQEGIDLESAIKALTELRAKTKRSSRQQLEQEVGE
jgi:hypothetical protein